MYAVDHYIAKKNLQFLDLISFKELAQFSTLLQRLNYFNLATDKSANICFRALSFYKYFFLIFSFLPLFI